jgi:hypothetical protein
MVINLWMVYRHNTAVAIPEAVIVNMDPLIACKLKLDFNVFKLVT